MSGSLIETTTRKEATVALNKLSFVEPSRATTRVNGAVPSVAFPDISEEDAQAWATGRVQLAETVGDVLVFHVEVCPALANALLARNLMDAEALQNRSRKQSVVGLYARQMRTGAWTFTGDTVVVSKRGWLLNGQHRLSACVTAGASFSTLVVFGIDESAYPDMDVGSKRTHGDLLTSFHIANGKELAAAGQWVFRSLTSGFGQINAVKKLSPGEMHAFLGQHPDLAKSIPFGEAVSRTRLLKPSLATGAHYLCAQRDRDLADRFFATLADGVGLSAGDPVGVLRKALTLGSVSSRRLSDQARIMYLVKAWNAARTGRPIKFVKFTDGEQVPELE